MSLFKRREYWLELPDGTRVHAFQAPDPATAATKAQALATQHGISQWSLWRDPQATYACSLSHQGKRYLTETHFTDLPSARKYETAFKRALAEGRLDELKSIHLRRAPEGLTIGALLPHWRSFAAASGISEGARRQYENALRVIWERGTGQTEGWEAVALTEYTPALVFRFKEAVLKAAAADEDASDARAQQLRRSANSVLRQSKGMFSRRALEHYRLVARLVLPATLPDFLSSPGFPDTTKEEYHSPPDAVVSATFQSLDKSKETHRNRYVAVWLALGFGLRKSEIAAVRAGWFIKKADGVQLELRATVVPGKVAVEKESTKNGQVFPRIDVSNGAWEKLEPLLASLKPEEYVLQCPTATDRVEGVFRGISAWMQELGWGTTKQVHEFRAFAGCQVAVRDGIEAASRWLRHSSILVTQRHYGRYLRPKITNAPLVFTSIQKAQPLTQSHAPTGS